MIGSSRRLKVYALAEPVDMRKGFDGLAALVMKTLGRAPIDGALYLFVSRNRIRAKVLMWDGTGLCLYCKRLEQGRFPPLWRREEDGEIALSIAELTLFLEGCEVVGKRSISPPVIDPQRPIAGDLNDIIRLWSTSKKHRISSNCAPSAGPMKRPSEYWSTASKTSRADSPRSKA
ncbi:MAG: IS66 family insertion sequence element accessory protein TnpB [Acidobacteriota bacterium]